MDDKSPLTGSGQGHVTSLNLGETDNIWETVQARHSCNGESYNILYCLSNDICTNDLNNPSSVHTSKAIYILL